MLCCHHQIWTVHQYIWCLAFPQNDRRSLWMPFIEWCSFLYIVFLGRSMCPFRGDQVSCDPKQCLGYLPPLFIKCMCSQTDTSCGGVFGVELYVTFHWKTAFVWGYGYPKTRAMFIKTAVPPTIGTRIWCIETALKIWCFPVVIHSGRIIVINLRKHNCNNKSVILYLAYVNWFDIYELLC